MLDFWAAMHWPALAQTVGAAWQEEQAVSAKGWQGRELQSSQLAQKLQEAEAALEQQGIDQRREQASSQVPHDARLELPLALTLLSVQYISMYPLKLLGAALQQQGIAQRQEQLS